MSKRADFSGFERQPGCSTMPPAQPGGARSSGKAGPPAVSTYPPKVPGRRGRSQLDWVRRVSRPGEKLTNAPPGVRGYTMEQIRQHNTQKDCWMVLNGKVYDMTEFMEYHPGGIGEMMRAAGDDGTKLYNEIHPWVNLEFLASKLIVGYVLEEGDAGASEQSGAAPAPAPAPVKAPSVPRTRPALHPESWKPFRLLLRKRLGCDSFLFRFILLPGESLGMEPGQHILVSGKSKDGERVERPLTPVSLPWEGRSFDLWVKIYPQGKLSSALERVKPGQVVELRGPRGPVRYRPGVLSFDNGTTFNQVSRLLLLGGGSGVTPLVQLLRVLTAKPGDATRAHLVYCNHTREAVMGEDVLRDIAAKSEGRVRVTFVTTEPVAEGGWDGITGRLSTDLLRSLVDAPESDHACLWCGPPGFNNVARAAAAELGFQDSLCHEL